MTVFIRLGALAGHVGGIIGLGRRVFLARLAHRDLQQAKAPLRRSNRRFAASGLFRLEVTVSSMPRVRRP